MHQPRTVSLVKSAHVAATRWADPAIDHHPHFAELAMALLPASLILATATALLVVLI